MNAHAPASDGRTADLQPHPACLPAVPCRLRVHVERTGPSVLQCEYVLETDLSRWRIPAPGLHARTDRLWQHTCFEAFVRVPGAARYLECNFSPSSAWALYQFDAYRQGMRTLDVDSEPLIRVEKAHTSLRLWSQVWLPETASSQHSPDCEIALSAVLEDVDGSLSYWALAHPPGKPDFHHAAGFVLSLRGTPS